MKFAFFGTPDIAVYALEELESFGFTPSLIVCNEDAPVGRKHTLTPPPTKVWAHERDIPVLQPATLRSKDALPLLYTQDWDFFVVFAYGKILPKELLEHPRFGTINAHPSLLPKLRGASPIRSTLLHDLSACGVTIIQMDEELDHGPMLAQQAVALYDQPIPGLELDVILARISGCLLADVMQKIPAGHVSPIPQDHASATFCTKITKDMGELQIDPRSLPHGEEAYDAYRKICAFDGWPGTFFFYQGKRVKITEAHLEDNTLMLTRVIPEGRKEMLFEAYVTSLT